MKPLLVCVKCGQPVPTFTSGSRIRILRQGKLKRENGTYYYGAKTIATYHERCFNAE